MTDRPLAGLRVVITRAAHQNEQLAAALRDLGAEAIHVPLIAIGDPADGGTAISSALQRLHTFDWLVVTSPNGAKRVAGALGALGAVRPKVAAIGTATAAALAAPAELVPVEQTTDGLIQAFPSGTGSVLVAQAEIAGLGLANGLTAKGWRVEVAPAYGTVMVNASAASRAAALSADAVLFASGSAVRSWFESFSLFVPPLAIAIGPSTHAVARRLGLKITAICADHSSSGLVDCLVACVLAQQ